MPIPRGDGNEAPAPNVPGPVRPPRTARGPKQGAVRGRPGMRPARRRLYPSSPPPGTSSNLPPSGVGGLRVSWWGTVLGGTFGFLIGGPIGAVLGAALGRSFDRALDRTDGVEAGAEEAPSRERAQLAFFTATFGVMGRVARADGHVSPDEIRLANQVMDELGLDPEQRQAARAVFNEGKSPRFPLDEVLGQLRSECGRATNLLRMFLEIQLQAAWADGGIHPEERRLLLHVAARLGFPQAVYLELERMVGAAVGAGGPGRTSAGPSLEDAYAMLGVGPEASDAEVKRAYRRLMSRHHPDKLAARGLPEEMMRAATERTQQIKAAWDRVQAARAGRDASGPRTAA